MEFEKQNDDGSWTATFDCKEFHDALQWLYDIKWTRGVLQDNMSVDATEQQRIFGTGQAGIMLKNTSCI